MGAPQSDKPESDKPRSDAAPAAKSLHHRMSNALERIERLTEQTDDGSDDHVDPKTVEEAVERLKQKVTDKDG